MIYRLQTLSLKVRFAWLLVPAFPVLVFQWLVASAPWALARLQVLSGGAGLPDSRFWYRPEELRALLTAWGPAGREVYLTALWPADTGFLAAYGVLLAAGALYLLKKLNPKAPAWYAAALVPLAGAACDFLENALTVLNAWLPASGWEPVAWIEAVFTAGKWVFLVAGLAFLAGGTLVHLVGSGMRKLRAGRPASFEPVKPEEPGRN